MSEFTFTEYLALEVVVLFEGHVKLTSGQQLRRQARRCEPVDEAEGIYKITSQVMFKPGEVFLYTGSVPKQFIQNLTEDKKEITAAKKVIAQAEKDAAAKVAEDQALSDQLDQDKEIDPKTGKKIKKGILGKMQDAVLG